MALSEERRKKLEEEQRKAAQKNLQAAAQADAAYFDKIESERAKLAQIDADKAYKKARVDAANQRIANTQKAREWDSSFAERRGYDDDTLTGQARLQNAAYEQIVNDYYKKQRAAYNWERTKSRLPMFQTSASIEREIERAMQDFEVDPTTGRLINTRKLAETNAKEHQRRANALRDYAVLSRKQDDYWGLRNEKTMQDRSRWMNASDTGMTRKEMNNEILAQDKRFADINRRADEQEEKAYKTLYSDLPNRDTIRNYETQYATYMSPYVIASRITGMNDLNWEKYLDPETDTDTMTKPWAGTRISATPGEQIANSVLMEYTGWKPTVTIGDQVSGYHEYMTDNEKAVILQMAEKRKFDDIEKYFNALKPTLDARMYDKQQGIIDRSPRAVQAMYGVTGVVTAPAAYLQIQGDNLINNINRLAVNSGANPSDLNWHFTDTKSGAVGMTGLTSYARAKSLENNVHITIGGKDVDLSGVVEWLGQTVYSTLDNLVLSGLGPEAMLAVMAMGAAGQTGVDILNRGGTQGQAATMSTIAGAVEYITEKAPIDELFKIKEDVGIRTFREIMGAMGRVGGSEGMEEGISAFVNFLAEAIVMGDKSEFEMAVRKYEEKGKSHDEAVRLAGKDFLIDAAKESASGFLSGAGMAGGRAVRVSSVLNKADLSAGRNITDRSRVGGSFEDIVIAEGMNLKGDENKALRAKAGALESKRYQNRDNADFKWSNKELRQIGEIYDALDTEAKDRVSNVQFYREAQRNAEQNAKIAADEARMQEERDRNMTPEEFDEEIARRAQESGNKIDMGGSESMGETMTAEEYAADLERRAAEAEARIAQEQQSAQQEQQTRQLRGSDEYTDRVDETAPQTQQQTEAAEMARLAQAAETAAKTGDYTAMDEARNATLTQPAAQTAQNAAPETTQGQSAQTAAASAPAQQTQTAQPTQAAQTVTPESAARTTAENARKSGLSAKDALTMSSIARDVGANLAFMKMNNSRVHGFYNRKTHTVVLNQDLSTSDMAWTTFAHEITHHSETAGSYSKLVDVAKHIVAERGNYSDPDDAWNSYVRLKRRQYADLGQALSQQDAEFEAVAVTVENVLGNKEAMENVVRYSREDAQALLASIDNILDRTTSNSTAITPESARLVQAQKALAAALNEVREQENAESRTEGETESESATTKAPESRPGDVGGEVEYSLALDEQYQEDAEKKNESSKNVDAEILKTAGEIRARVKQKLESVKETANLPPDTLGYTAQKNGSYGLSEENTTVCPRSISIDALSDLVAEYLGRPLTVEESVYVAQEAFNLTDTPQCLYCYVWMDRLAKKQYLGEYIEKRDSVIKNLQNGMSVEEAREAFKRSETKDGKEPKNWTKAREKRFNEWVRNYQTGADIIQLSDLASEETAEKAMKNRQLAPQIKDALSYAQSASYAKKRSGYVAYNGHILRWDAKRINQLNSMFGLRMYSFSDFSPAFVLENMQMVTDSAVRGLKMLAYTKDLDFVRIFAPTNMNINISVFGMDGPNGTVAEDGMQGAHWKEAQELRSQHPNVGITFVATNDTQVEWALAQDWIDVVIPFHMVKTGAQVAKIFGYQNYTGEQADRAIKGRNDGTKEVYPSEHQNNREKYFAALEKHGLEPRFARWQDNPNYMKLVNETRRSAQDTPVVQPIFDEDAAIASIDNMVKHGGYNVPIGGDLENMRDYAEELGGNIAKGMAKDLQIRNGIIQKKSSTSESSKYSLGIDTEGKQFSLATEEDEKYLAAVDKGDMDTAQRMVDEAAKQAMPDSAVKDDNGKLLRMYHGTRNFGFTKFDYGRARHGLFGIGHYFTDNPYVAFGYLDKGKGNNPGIYTVYLNMRNPIDMDAKADLSKWRKAFNDYGADVSYLKGANTNEDCYRAIEQYYSDELVPHREAAEDIQSMLEYMGYGGITHIGGGRYNHNDDTRHRVYIAFNSEQIKSADPVVYDDNGKPIPLSERFIPENPDIRYSIGGFDFDADIKEAIQKYGRMKPGEQFVDEQGNPVTQKADVANAYSEGKKARGYYRTALESQHSKGMEADLKTRAIVDQYVPTSNEKNMAAAKALRGEHENFERAYGAWTAMVRGDTLPKGTSLAEYVAFGQQLAIEARQEGNYEAALNIISDIAETGTSIAQGLQAYQLLKRLSPEGQLMRYRRVAENMDARAKKNEGKPLRKAPKTKEAKRAVNISDVLQQFDENLSKLEELRKNGGTEAEIEKVLHEIEKLQNRMQKVAGKTTDAQGKLATAEKQYNELKQELDDKRDNLRKLKDRYKRLQDNDKTGEPGMITKTASKIYELQQEIDYLTPKVEKLRNEYNELKQELHEKYEERAKLKAEDKRLDERIPKTKQTIEDLKADIEELNEKVTPKRIELEQLLSEEKLKRGERKTLKKELDSLNRRTATLERKIYSQMADMMNMMADMAVKESNYAELREQLKLVKSSKQIMNDFLRYAKAHGGVEIPGYLERAYLAAKTEEERDFVRKQIEIAIADQLPGTWVEKLRAVRYTFMLMSPTTHESNIGGNAGQYVMSGISDSIATGIESVFMRNNMKRYAEASAKAAETQKLIDKLSEERARLEIGPDLRNLPVTGDRVERLKSIDAQMEAARKDLQEALHTIVKNERTHAIVTPFTDKALFAAAAADYKVIAADLQAGGKRGETAGIEEHRKIFNFKPMEALRKVVSDTLEGEDKFFLKLSYTRAYAEYMKANNLTADTMTDAQKDRARSVAFMEALKNTYRDPSALANAIRNIEQMNPASEILVGGLMPFKKTPINVAKRAVENSPLGLLRSLNDLRLIATGKETNRNKSTMIGDFCKAFNGTTLFALGILGSSMGLLFATPGAGDKERDKKMEEETGQQNYSIKIGNYTYTLSWLSPWPIPLFAGVRAKEVWNEINGGFDTPEAAFDSLMEAFVSMLNPMFEMTMLQGITDMMKSYQKEDSGIAASFVWSALESLALQFVPTLGGRAARIIDPYQRSTRAQGGTFFVKKLEQLRRRFMAKVPGLTYLLEPVMTQYGTEKENVGGNIAGKIAYQLFSPGYLKEVTHKASDEEMKRLYEVMQKSDPNNATSVLPRTVPTSVSMNNETYYLSAKDYTNFSRRMGQQAYSDIDALIETDEYKTANDVQKAKMIRKVWDDAYEQAKIAYFKDLGIGDEYYKTGAEHSIEDLIYDDSEGYRQYKNLEAVRQIYEQGLLNPEDVYNASQELSHISKTGDKLAALGELTDRLHLTQDEYDFLYMTKIADSYMQEDMQAVIDAGGTLDEAINTVARYYYYDETAVDSRTGEVGKWVTVDKGQQAGYLAQSKLSDPAKEAFYLNKIVSGDENRQKEAAKIADYYSRGLSINDYLNSWGIKYDDAGTAYERAGYMYEELLQSDLSDKVKEAAIVNLLTGQDKTREKVQARINDYYKRGLTINDFLEGKGATYDENGKSYESDQGKYRELLESNMSSASKEAAVLNLIIDNDKTRKTVQEEIDQIKRAGLSINDYLTAKVALYDKDGDSMTKTTDQAQALLDSKLSDKAKTVLWYTVISDAKGAKEEVETFCKGGNTVNDFLRAKVATSKEGMKAADKAKAVLDLNLKSYTAAMQSVVTTSENKIEGMDAALTFLRAHTNADKIVATSYAKYAEIYARDDINGSKKAQEFSYWLDNDPLTKNLNSDEKDNLKNTFAYYNMVRADAGKYDKLMQTGKVSSSSAQSISADLAALKPLEGKKTVSDAQRIEAIANNKTASASEIDAAIGQIFDSSDDGNEAAKLTAYKAIRASGISASTFATFYTKTSVMSSDKDSKGKDIKGRTRQDKIWAYIDSMPISTKQKDEMHLFYYKKSTLNKAPWN